MDKENDYKGILVKLITEIKRNLQNMELIDLENDTLLNPDYPSEIHYPVSKLFSCDFDSSRNPLFDDFLKELNEYSNNLFDFNSNQPRDELFLKCKLMLYYYKK